MNRLLLLRPHEERMTLEPISVLAPSIEMTWEVFRDTSHLIGLTRHLGKEISWVGKVDVRRQESADVYVIAEIRVLRQESTAAETTLNPVALGQTAREWIRACGGNDNPCRFWGHTHVSGSPDPSPQDDRQMLAFVRTGGPPFFIRGIFCPENPALPSTGEVYHPAFAAELASGWSRADFSLYDYQKGVIFRHVPWSIVDGEREEELAAQVGRCMTIVPSDTAAADTSHALRDGLATGVTIAGATPRAVPARRKKTRRRATT